LERGISKALFEADRREQELRGTLKSRNGLIAGFFYASNLLFI